jgi:GDP-L-fucose synthase|tara:strand:+ start:5890 stop:6786 length:897 start_codon:yes stop_codon:yes gene_type:complete
VSIVLVTGGTGFLGKSLVKVKPDWIYLSSADCDLTSYSATKKVIGEINPDAIVHLAGIVGGIKENAAKQGEFFYKNVSMNTNVLEASRVAGVPRVLSCLSTCAFPNTVDEYPFKETDIFSGPPASTNFSYGYSKRMLYVQTLAYRKQYGLNYSTFCPSNLYGPHDCYDSNRSHFVAALVKKMSEAKNDDVLEFWGTGTPLRQQLYVEDLAELIPELLILHNSSKPLLVTPPENISINDMVFEAKNITNKKISVIYNNKLDGQYRKDGSNKEFLKIFGDYNFTSFKKGFKETYDWYNKQ